MKKTIKQSEESDNIFYSSDEIVDLLKKKQG